jgi:hypothetical protein
MGKMKQEWQEVREMLEGMSEEQLEQFVQVVEKMAIAKKGASLHETNQTLQ